MKTIKTTLPANTVVVETSKGKKQVLCDNCKKVIPVKRTVVRFITETGVNTKTAVVDDETAKELLKRKGYELVKEKVAPKLKESAIKKFKDWLKGR